MLSPSIQSVIQQNLSNHFGSNHPIHFSAVGGGSINETYRINFTDKHIFCKTNSATKFPHLFTKEVNGLTLLRQHRLINVPSVISCFEKDDTQILLLEWINEEERTDSFWKKFGAQLAALHRQSTDYFGLSENNYMGSVPQSNRPHFTWIEFFIEERLQPMITRCYDKNTLTKSHLKLFEKMSQRMQAIFNEENPSLLHGDLWSGNFMCHHNNEPVLIDPAVYYGHRSVDLAMTTLFGGFHHSFYESYHYHFPFPVNYKEQWAVCNLYPLLIHLYLFGRSYLSQIERTISAFQ